jgi:dTDP-4-amino-4,6-dideoxygalactose transaminase
MGDPRIVTVGRPILPDLDLMKDLMAEAVAANWLSNFGSLHNRLERQLAPMVGTGSTQLVSSGTMALMVALKLGNLPDGAEVITSPLSFAATVQAITWCGYKPVFADVDPVTLTLCPEAVRAAITPRTAAILPVHFVGVPCDVDALSQIAKDHGLWLAFDAAHAFMLELKGRPISSWGDVSAFSLHATKLMHTGEGGAVVFPGTHDPQSARMRNFGMQDGRMTGLGTNAKLSEAQAAVGLAVLPKLDAEIEQRQKLHRLYDDALQGIEGIRRHDSRPQASDSLLYYPLRMPPAVQQRVFMALAQERIFARDHFALLCGQGTYLPDAQIVTTKNTAQAPIAGPELLCLPFHGGVTAEDVARIADIIGKNSI